MSDLQQEGMFERHSSSLPTQSGPFGHCRKRQTYQRKGGGNIIKTESILFYIKTISVAQMPNDCGGSRSVTFLGFM